MFTTDPTIVDLKIKERNLYKAIFSMNFHQVATPELGVDEARFYLFIFREGSKFSAYIVLYMPNSGRRAYYTHSSNPFPEADLPMVEDVARAFGEEMGFFLDEKSFASASSVEKNLWIDEQPLFGFKTPEEQALADALRMSETTAAPAAEQPTAPAGAAGKVASTIPEAPAPPPAAQPIPAAPEYQPTPWAPAAQPIPAAPIYPQAPAQPVPAAPPAAPVYYQPAPAAPIAQPAPAAPVQYQPTPAAPTAQPAPAAPVHYQPTPAAPTVQPAPAYYQPAPPAQPAPAAPVSYRPEPAAPAAQPAPPAPVYYQPAPTSPPAAQTPPQPRFQKEIEIEPQVEVEEEVDVRPPRQKSSVAPRSSMEKGKAPGAAPRTARPMQPNLMEGEQHTAQKNTPPVPKQAVKKETRGAVGVVGREMEALARLMASF
jgi:hypothetical protein